MRGSVCGMLAMAGVVMAGTGCGSDVTAPRSAIAPPSASFAKGGGDDSGDRVTGSAAIVLPGFANSLEHYSVSAIRHRDGSVSGELEEFSEQDGGQRIHGSVVCFTVAGNTARLAARLDRSDVPFGPVGSYVIWSVVDDGTGKAAEPDLSTDIYFGADERVARFHCDTGAPLAPYYPSVRGELHVSTR